MGGAPCTRHLPRTWRSVLGLCDTLRSSSRRIRHISLSSGCTRVRIKNRHARGDQKPEKGHCRGTTVNKILRAGFSRRARLRRARTGLRRSGGTHKYNRLVRASRSSELVEPNEFASRRGRGTCSRRASSRFSAHRLRRRGAWRWGARRWAQHEWRAGAEAQHEWRAGAEKACR